MNKQQLIEELFKRSGAMHIIGPMGCGGLHGYQIGNYAHGGYRTEHAMKKAWAREEVGTEVINAFLAILKDQAKQLSKKEK